MTAVKKTMYGLDATKYPARMGQSWGDDEVIKLLTSIQKKKSIEEISEEHERTVGSINSYLRKLALDYHRNDKRPIEEIQKFTGLTRYQIEDVIQKHEVRESVIRVKKEDPTMTEVVSLLKDIQEKLNILLEKVA